MLRGSQIIGSSIQLPDGTSTERVVSWILDTRSNRLLGFLVSPGGWRGGARILLWQSVRALTPDTVTVACDVPVIDIGAVMQVKQILESQNSLVGLLVITRSGQHLGEVIDIFIDPTTGTLQGLATTGYQDNGYGSSEFCISVHEPLHTVNGFVIATQRMAASIQHLDAS